MNLLHILGRPAPFKNATSRKAHIGLELLEDRLVPSALGYRAVDESNNNLTHSSWGTAGTDLVRLARAAYGDGMNSPSLSQDLSARAISNIVNNQADPANPGQDINTVDRQSLSDFGYAFGQFMDHDMDLTPDGGASLPIPVATGDPIGPNPLPFTRSQIDPNTGTSTRNPRQQVNEITSYLDLSQVYGSDTATAAALRLGQFGLLATSDGNMLPYDSAKYFGDNPLSMQNGGSTLPLSDLFAAGDVRANETLELTALQTLFMRNHNRIAGALHTLHPLWGDELLYQEARKINIADYQSIVYNEWIPAVLGNGALSAYAGYNPNVNPSIANEFSTVAFRFGHSLLSGEIERHDNQGQPIPDPGTGDSTIPLSQDFFDPYLLNPGGAIDPLTGHVSSDIGAVLKASADGVAQAMDVMAIEDVRNLLFGDFGAGGQDLMARDVQRGRDNGIPDYNTLRAADGLPRVTSFAQITSNVQVQQELKAAYGSVNNIDAFEGGLAEDHVRGSDVGPLFETIMVNQFARLRNGDRFFYLNEQLSPEEVNFIRQGNTLAEVIEANTDITNLQPNVFFFKASISGSVVASQTGSLTTNSSLLSGIKVQLEDASGAVLATTVTDFTGRYSFNQLSGIGGTGTYQVVLVLPSWLQQTTPNPADILITRGDTNVQGVSFGVAFAGGWSPWDGLGGTPWTA